ncbi:MAG: M81 family metallopeptidase, partial [Proteobacteria bacterium]|nr:M81 family metallopeptidase [Pseudomonadota bacterium]
FFSRMDGLGDWTPVPILVTAAEPGGPVDAGFFGATLERMRTLLKAALPLNGVYLSNHGGMVATDGPDPDGALYAMVRETVGSVPFVSTVDLHANISERMVASVDALVSYRTNPHVDQAERAMEAAELLDRFMRGARSRRAFVRLPMTPASVTLLTREGPYADAIARGQEKLGRGILNVSVVGGFVFSDTPKNGLCVVVNGEGEADVGAVACDLAGVTWSERGRFLRTLMPMQEAVARAVKAGNDASAPACILSDAGDNPGGGGSGTTTGLLEALVKAGAKQVLYGVFFEPSIAAQAHAAGEGAEIDVIFNETTATQFAQRFGARARVLCLTDGRCVGRRGIWAGRALDLGATCALAIGGITVVVLSRRKQCADPVLFEMHGLDIAAARSVAVKSRGHFRAGFDEFFPPERVLEVDTPGLTSPVLERMPFKGLPRPVFPLDRDIEWTPSVTLFGD